MADPAQHKRNSPWFSRPVTSWRRHMFLCFCQLCNSWRSHLLLRTYPQAYTGSQLRSLRRAPGRLDHRPVHIVRFYFHVLVVVISCIITIIMLLCVGGGCTSLPPVQPPGRPAPLSGRHDPRGGGLLASEPRGFVKWLEARPPQQLKLSRSGSSWAATAQVEPQQLKLSRS